MSNLTPSFENYMQYIRETTKYTKAFNKMAKKLKKSDNIKKNEKAVSKFTSDFLEAIWHKNIEDKFSAFKNVPNEKRFLYIYGMFVLGHSKAVTDKLKGWNHFIKEVQEYPARTEGV